jgi:hypothetical protein
MCGCNKERNSRSAPAPVANPNSFINNLRNRARIVPKAVPHENVNTSMWGPPLWRMMHILSSVILDYTLLTQEDYMKLWEQLFLGLKEEIPCPECRSHVQNWLSKNPDFRSRGIQQYILDLHNDVNVRRGVAQWTIQQVETTYSVGGKEKQLSLIPLLISSVSMMPKVTSSIQILLASVS